MRRPFFLESDKVVVHKLHVRCQAERAPEKVARQINFQEVHTLAREGHVPTHQRDVRQKLEVGVGDESQFALNVRNDFACDQPEDTNATSLSSLFKASASSGSL